jgi:histidinol-phosphate aminotransferase
MKLSRRHLLKNISTGVAASAVLPALPKLSFAASPFFPRASAPGGPIILSRNENAYGPSDTVMAAMRESLSVANRYAFANAKALAEKLAYLHGVKAEQVVLGCGSGEILSIAAAAFLGPGKNLIQASPTFEAIGRCAQTVGAQIIGVPLTKNYAHDLAAMLAKTDARTGLIYICNPNNPTATLTPRRDLEAFVRKLPATTTVLIDEAYHHFVEPSADYSSFIDTPFQDERVFACRTFSKVYGLAGIRAGYAVAAPRVAHTLATWRLPEGINAVAAQAAIAGLDDQEHVRMSIKRNADDRQEFFNQAHARMVRGIDSHTNFAMLQVGRPATEVIEFFKQNNIEIARPFPPMDHHVRVSFGTPPQMKEFWRVWDLMPGNKMAM